MAGLSIRRGTTPTIRCLVSGDISYMTVYLILKRRGSDPVVLTGEDLDVEYDSAKDKTSVSFKMSQEDTLSYKARSSFEVQVRAVSNGGSTAFASGTAKIGVKDILYEEVLHGN